MFNQSFALMLRSLRVDSRQHRFHLLRAVLTGILIVSSTFNFALGASLSATGLLFFSGIIWTNVWFLVLGGPVLFGTVIAEEKEERTLQLLKIANVTPLAILAGKTVPLLVSVLLVLAIQAPFLMLAVTMGGVSYAQIAAAFVAMLAFLFFVCMLSTLCSVVFRTSGAAITAAMILLLVFFMLPGIGWFAIEVIRELSGNANALQPQLEAIGAVSSWSVFFRTSEIMYSGYDGGMLGPQVISNVILGILLFGLAWLLFEPCNAVLDDVAGGKSARKKKKLAVAESGKAGEITSVARTTRTDDGRRCWTWALSWRDFFFQAGGTRGVVGKALVYGALITGLVWLASWNSQMPDLDDIGLAMAGYMFWLVLPVETSILVARTFRGEIKDKTLTTLMMLPKSTAQVAYEKLAGNLLALLPVTGYVLLGVLMCPELIETMAEAVADEPIFCFLFVWNIVAQFLLFQHLVAYFSIITNAWAGLLLAGLLHYFGALTVVGIFMMVVFWLLGISDGTEEMAYFIFTVAAISTTLLVLALHWEVGRRLEAKAAES